MLCMRACPTAAIFIDAPRGEDKKRQLKVFNVDLGICCFCGLCEEACNFSAIKLAPKYEFSTENKDDLMWDMNRLQEVGRDVAYEAKPKKKPVPKPENQPAAAAANPGAEKAAEQKPEQGGSDDKKEGEA